MINMIVAQYPPFPIITKQNYEVSLPLFYRETATLQSLLSGTPIENQRMNLSLATQKQYLDIVLGEFLKPNFWVLLLYNTAIPKKIEKYNLIEIPLN